MSQTLLGLEPTELFPLLNVASSTLKYRTEDYPYIQAELFGPLERRGGPIWHQDLKQAPGVDIVGDLLDPRLLERLLALEPRVVLCNGCLLHVRDLERACEALGQLVPPGGYLCVTTPEAYPFCSDPWDSGYRPSPQQLAGRFPHFRVLALESVVQADSSYFLSLLRDPRQAFLFCVRLLTPFWKPRNWLGLIRSLPSFFKPYKAACVWLQRPTRETGRESF